MRKSLLFLCVLVLALLSCGDDGTIDIMNLEVKLSVAPRYGTLNAAAGYPIKVRVEINEDYEGTDVLFLHLFERDPSFVEEGFFYQGSTTFYPGFKKDLHVWLGGEGDVHREYEVFAVVNKTSHYEKVNEEYLVQELPELEVGKIDIFRVK